MYVMFSCDFVTFPYAVLGQVWHLIVSIPDLCRLPYFVLLNSADPDEIPLYGAFHLVPYCLTKYLLTCMILYPE